MRDTFSYNSKAWDAEAAKDNPWTKPVDEAAIAAAREGVPRIVLTPTIPVPSEWLMPLRSRLARMRARAQAGREPAQRFRELDLVYLRPRTICEGRPTGEVCAAL